MEHYDAIAIGSGEVHIARLLSVNVGRPREIAWRGKMVYTSVWKEPVEGRRRVRPPAAGNLLICCSRPQDDLVIDI
jgi:hypothetical protein